MVLESNWMVTMHVTLSKVFFPLVFFLLMSGCTTVDPRVDADSRAGQLLEDIVTTIESGDSGRLESLKSKWKESGSAGIDALRDALLLTSNQKVQSELLAMLVASEERRAFGTLRQLVFIEKLKPFQNEILEAIHRFGYSVDFKSKEIENLLQILETASADIFSHVIDWVLHSDQSTENDVNRLKILAMNHSEKTELLKKIELLAMNISQEIEFNVDEEPDSLDFPEPYSEQIPNPEIDAETDEMDAE